MNVVLVEPHKESRVIEIDNSLESMQKIVGGLIEPVYMPDDACIICNEEGKMNGLELNRALYDQDHEIYDIIAGTFFVCYAPPDSDEFESLPKELLDKYENQFKTPEIFFRNLKGQIFAVPEVPEDKERKKSLSEQIDNAINKKQNDCKNSPNNVCER